MMPIIASINVANTIPPPIVSTPLPDTSAQRVPYDNVPPPVSNAPVDNNARGNSAPLPEAPPQSIESEVDQAFSAYLTNNAVTLNINAQATFLAQLIGQNITIPPETAGILVQYEKMAAFSNVKYKPSNAFRPQPAPSNAFSAILHPTATVNKIVEPKPAPAPKSITLPAEPALPTPVNDNAPVSPAQQAAAIYARHAAPPAVKDVSELA